MFVHVREVAGLWEAWLEVVGLWEAWLEVVGLWEGLAVMWSDYDKAWL
jgi:hypothetical protein